LTATQLLTLDHDMQKSAPAAMVVLSQAGAVSREGMLQADTRGASEQLLGILGQTIVKLAETAATMLARPAPQPVALLAQLGGDVHLGAVVEQRSLVNPDTAFTMHISRAGREQLVFSHIMPLEPF